MKKANFGNALIASVLIGGMLTAANVLADPQQGGSGQGYGMMGGNGQGYGMGLGMMGGNGQGYGMGSGMMPGYDQGRGMGSGMIGGYGMGLGMMGNYGIARDLNLSKDQRSKVDKIQGELRRKHWDLMGKMHDEEALMNEQYDAEPRDDAALSKSFRKMSDLRQQMFDLSLASRHQIDAVLTKEQREKLQQGR